MLEYKNISLGDVNDLAEMYVETFNSEWINFYGKAIVNTNLHYGSSSDMTWESNIEMPSCKSKRSGGKLTWNG